MCFFRINFLGDVLFGIPQQEGKGGDLQAVLSQPGARRGDCHYCVLLFEHTHPTLESPRCRNVSGAIQAKPLTPTYADLHDKCSTWK